MLNVNFLLSISNTDIVSVLGCWSTDIVFTSNFGQFHCSVFRCTAVFWYYSILLLDTFDIIGYCCLILSILFDTVSWFFRYCSILVLGTFRFYLILLLDTFDGIWYLCLTLLVLLDALTWYFRCCVARRFCSVYHSSCW